MQFTTIKPNEIEKRSFEIISSELGERVFPAGQAEVVKRVIHTSADFDYAENLVFSDHAISEAHRLLKAGAIVVTDTQMAMAGINKKMVADLGGEVCCFIAEEDVASEAKERGVTRATIAVEHASKLDKPVLFVVGNAPTALIRLYELWKEGQYTPAFVVGVPVGFVNVVESKELFLDSPIPHIIAKGRKGGSNVAAAIINALLYQMIQREGF